MDYAPQAKDGLYRTEEYLQRFLKSIQSNHYLLTFAYDSSTIIRADVVSLYTSIKVDQDQYLRFTEKAFGIVLLKMSMVLQLDISRLHEVSG